MEKEKRKAPDLKLRELRIKAGLTQNALAKLSGVSQSHISEMESGVKRVSLSITQRLADALNCSIEDLIRGEDEVKDPEEMDEESGHSSE